MHDGRAIDRHEQVGGGNMGLEQRIVPVVHGVAQAGRIDQQAHRGVRLAQAPPDASDAPGVEPFRVDVRHLPVAGQIAPVVIGDHVVRADRVHGRTGLPGWFMFFEPSFVRGMKSEEVAAAFDGVTAPSWGRRCSFDPDLGPPACGSVHHGSEPVVRTALCNARPSHRPPFQDGGTTTSGTCISSWLTPPWTPTWRSRFSPGIQSRIA